MHLMTMGLALLQVVANFKTVFGDWIKTPVQAFEEARRA